MSFSRWIFRGRLAVFSLISVCMPSYTKFLLTAASMDGYSGDDVFNRKADCIIQLGFGFVAVYDTDNKIIFANKLL